MATASVTRVTPARTRSVVYPWILSGVLLSFLEILTVTAMLIRRISGFCSVACRATVLD